jgi:hypothetical protein
MSVKFVSLEIFMSEMSFFFYVGDINKFMSLEKFMSLTQKLVSETQDTSLRTPTLSGNPEL